jgi:hypothetical protein
LKAAIRNGAAERLNRKRSGRMNDGETAAEENCY